MKKHGRFTKQISDWFLARKALTYWRNLIANYDENVSERDFFDYFARCDASGEAIRKIRAFYTKEQLEEIGWYCRKIGDGIQSRRSVPACFALRDCLSYAPCQRATDFKNAIGYRRTR